MSSGRKRSLRHLLIAIENNGFGALLELCFLIFELGNVIFLYFSLISNVFRLFSNVFRLFSKKFFYVLGCDELDLGLARVHDLSTEQLREMDPMNIAFVKLDDSLRIIKSGYLWKLSRSMVPTTTVGCASALVSKWSKRFFVLRADSCLYFFKKEQVSMVNTLKLFFYFEQY